MNFKNTYSLIALFALCSINIAAEEEAYKTAEEIAQEQLQKQAENFAQFIRLAENLHKNLNNDDTKQLGSLTVHVDENDLYINGRPYSQLTDIAHGGIQDWIKSFMRTEKLNRIRMQVYNGQVTEVTILEPSAAHRFDTTLQDRIWGKQTPAEAQAQHKIASGVQAVQSFANNEQSIQIAERLFACSKQPNQHSTCTYIAPFKPKEVKTSPKQPQQEKHEVTATTYAPSPQKVVENESCKQEAEVQKTEKFFGFSGGRTPFDRTFEENREVAEARVLAFFTKIQEQFNSKK